MRHFPKIFFLSTFLLSVPSMAEAAVPSEFLCDPEAKISIESPWVGKGTLRFQGEEEIVFPNQGKETSVLELADALGVEQLPSLSRNTSFESYQTGKTILHVEKSLLAGVEEDAVVILEKNRQASVYHCRSR